MKHSGNKTYIVQADITISTFTKVVAKSEKEALEKAEDKDLCDIHVSSYYTAEEFWVVEELDGTPKNLKAYVKNG